MEKSTESKAVFSIVLAVGWISAVKRVIHQESKAILFIALASVDPFDYAQGDGKIFRYAQYDRHDIASHCAELCGLHKKLLNSW